MRELFSKIVEWVDKYKQVGDTLVSHDPHHAAIPWAAVRFVLQAMVNEHKTYEAMISGLEHVSGLITRCFAIENTYLKSSLLRAQLEDALLKLYTAVLLFLARARRYYTRSVTGKLSSC